MYGGITDVDQLEEILEEKFNSRYKIGNITVRGVSVLDGFVPILKDVECFKVRSTDVWKNTFPRSGTTWTQEMLWLLMNNLDYEAAKKPILQRSPFLEISGFKNQIFKFSDDQGSSVDFGETAPDPRLMKTHLPWKLLPKDIRSGKIKPKIVYVYRDPKDVAVSYFHHSTAMQGYKGSFEEYCQLFLNDYFQYAPFWTHVFDFVDRGHEENILCLKYEDMKSDLTSTIKKVAAFLNVTLNESEIEKLQTHLSFDAMKKNTAVNYNTETELMKKTLNNEDSKFEFMRKGQVGDFKNHMTPFMINEFERWTEDWHYRRYGASGTTKI